MAINEQAKAYRTLVIKTVTYVVEQYCSSVDEVSLELTLSVCLPRHIPLHLVLMRSSRGLRLYIESTGAGVSQDLQKLAQGRSL